jgi:hypothetical protein
LKPKKKFSKSLARRKLHVAWSRAVRERDGYYCQWCLFDGRHNKNLCNHAHHIVSRSLSGTAGAFAVDNGMTLCYYCHINRLKAWVDEYIAFRDDWLARNVGVNYFTLRERYRGIVKFTEEFYEERLGKLVG